MLSRLPWLRLQLDQLRQCLLRGPTLPWLLERLREMKLEGRVFIVVLAVLGLTACPQATRYGGNSASAVGTPPAAGFAPAKLMLFGGVDHKTYLGCLNCSQYATDSVFNRFGSSGSQYSTDSIWNTYSDFGSPYSMYSACNQYATDPPVIVDHEGDYYGRLTINEYHSEIGAGRQYVNWLKQAVCH
jgi:hypothetical protein